MKGFYEQVIARLKEAGYRYVRCKGSHETWTDGRNPVTVSKNCYSRHTANQIMKDAGIDFRF